MPVSASKSKVYFDKKGVTMDNHELSETERVAAEGIISWAKEYEVVRTSPGRKLLKVITPQEEEQFYTLVSQPQPRLIFHEPVYFTVTVQSAKGECRAGHKIGDCWKFSWCTPADLCGSAYHCMYPIIHGLMLTSGRYEGPAAEQTLITCPDDGWITFRIERRRWTPDMWEQGTR
jgi:uncharacterized repeat protein (TIGR04076 family)